MTLPGYIIDETVSEDNAARVYRGRSIRDGAPVIIKAIREDAADPESITRLVNEYEVTRRLDVEDIVRPMRLERHDGSLALVMDDTGAASLREYMRAGSIALSTFFVIAIRVSRILGRLHERGIVHGDLTPDNILFDPAVRKVKLTGFGFAVRSAEVGKGTIAGFSPGAPQYMAPEQTGRLERKIDHRSDLYSLGVVLYKMLTGQLPLDAVNRIEWAHVHVAREPESPSECNPDIPLVVSSIVMKLLSKSPEDRYQSVYGLLRDLKECESQWRRTGKIEPFAPGRRDVSAHLRLPRRLYGRKEEADAVRSAFERVCAGESGVMLVSGYTGVGKTRLINEILRPIAAARGLFVTGKFDHLRRNTPYAAFAEAFGGLVRQLMTERQQCLDRWRSRIQHAVGRSGALITQAIPEVELIIGTQPPIETLRPKEAQNRALMVWRDFIQAFALREHPLVIFLDDLQWADAASLHLIKYLCQTRDNSCWLLAGAYRDSEVTETHPLMALLQDLKEEGCPVRSIELHPLERSHIAEFVSGVLHRPRKECNPLAEGLYRRSGGNPFFLIQLLTSIHHDGLLRFNVEVGRWEWNSDGIKGLQVADDVVDFILKRLDRLPERTQDVLKLAACLGNQFDLETLSIICETPRAETASRLLPAILAGLIGPQDCGEGSRDELYEFVHDRVQQTAYALIPHRDRPAAHLRIGRLILRNTRESEIGDRILSIMDHLNRGLDLVNNPAERLEMAEYNLAAGRRAKAGAAYDSALGYLRCGVRLLSADSWDAYYGLSYDLHIEQAQCEYMLGNVETAERLFDAVASRTRTKLERASIHGLRIILRGGIGDHDGAVRIGIDALLELGVRLPSRPGRIHYAREMLLFKWFMRRNRMDDLMFLPEMEDPVQRRIAELYVRLACVASITNSMLYGLIQLKAANQAVKYGNSEMACLGYVGYAITAVSVLGDCANGWRLAMIAINLSEKYNVDSSKCIVYFTVGAILSHWRQHGRAGVEYLEKAVRCGLDAGDVLVVGYAMGVAFENKYIMGVPLNEIIGEVRKAESWARRMKHDNLVANTVLYQHYISDLIGQTHGQLESDSGHDIISSGGGDRAVRATACLLRTQSCYLRGDYRGALVAAEGIRDCADSIMGFMTSAEYVFYLSLAIAAAYDDLPPRERRKGWKVLRKNQRQLKRWADCCAGNFMHRYLLVSAEMARLSGAEVEAAAMYDQSIQSAHDNGYVQNEAIASEAAARHYLGSGREWIAKMYLENAYQGYREWGGLSKARQLREQYPGLLAGTAEIEPERDLTGVIEGILNAAARSGGAPQELDTGAMRKAVDSLQSEVDPGGMVERLLEIAIENAGADKGCLILERDGDLFVEAVREGDGTPARVIAPVRVEKKSGLSRAVVRYAARTMETVVVNDRRGADIFGRDPYITRDSAKSIMCLPVLLSGIPIGVLYLENSLMRGVFTEGRIEVLKILLSQMLYVKTLEAFLEKDPVRVDGEGPLPLIEPLTAREVEVLELIAKGLSNQEIGKRLDMSINTVKTHVKNIYGKLQANRRVQAVAKARAAGIL